MKRIISTAVAIMLCLMMVTSCTQNPAKKEVSSNNPPPNSINVKLMIGNDKQWIFDKVQNILDTKGIKVDGKSIYISTDKAGTGEAMDKIMQPGADYIGWMPASSTHIQWANDLWYKKGNTKPIVDESYDTIFLSPTVIAMQESLAKMMGYPEKEIGWSDILKLSTDPSGWGIYGKSILNPVRFAHTHPAKSNSGLNALIAAEYAFSGKQKALDINDIKSNSEKLKQLEQTIVHYGDSTALLQKKILEKGPKFIQYAVLYEYMVADMNSKNKDKEKVVAIYPKEGTIWGDVCFTNVYAVETNESQKKALQEIKKVLLSEEIQKMGMDSYFFRPASSNIPLSQAISKSNGVDPLKPQTTLELPKIEVVNAILEDWQKTMKKRANVLFVMDKSGSMSGEPLENSISALSNLFKVEEQKKNYTSIDSEDTISLMTFSSDISDVYTVKGKDLKEMDTILSSINAEGSTALYDAIRKAIAGIDNINKQDSSKKINMIVVLTDGRDNHSEHTFKSLIADIDKNEGKMPIIMTVGYGDDVDKDLLEEIADKTGGKYYEGNPDTILKLFEQIKTFF